jgi:hypothetical protein
MITRAAQRAGVGWDFVEPAIGLIRILLDPVRQPYRPGGSRIAVAGAPTQVALCLLRAVLSGARLNHFPDTL